MLGALIGVGLPALLILISMATAFQAWLSQSPAWALLKTSLSALFFSLILTVIVLGEEFDWWYIHGEHLDNLGIIWLVLTVVVAIITYWLVHDSAD